MRCFYTALRVWIPLLLAVRPVAARGAEPWWHGAWRYRREVTVRNLKPTRLPGGDIVRVTFATAGLCKGDGSDIRVATAAGRPVVSRVLMMGPGDQARVAFAKSGWTKTYYVYFGNPKPPPRRAELEIRRGVLLETRGYKAGGASNLAQARKTFENSRTLIGRSFRDRIFLGHNPFSERGGVANLFVGHLVCPGTGEYTFCCSSSGGSFLLVDDKVVVNNGGWHGPQRDIRKRGTIRLTAGLHKLTFYHINPRGSPIAVAAWRPPGETRIRVIPPGAYALVHSGEPGMLHERGKLLNVDFTAVHAGETFMNNLYFQRYKLIAKAAGSGASRFTWRWDFGDGQTSADAEVEHVYLAPGPYTVTVTGRAPTGRQFARTNRIVVSRPWDRVTRSDLDSIARHAEIVSTYDFTTLAPNAVADAFELLKRAGRTRAMLEAGKAFITRRTLPGKGVRAVVPVCADALLRAGRTDEAVAVLVRGAEKCDDPAAAAEVTVRAADVLLQLKHDDKKAMTLYTRVLGRYGRATMPAIRDAKIGIGDVWRFRGEYEKAARAYAQAGVGPAAAGKKHPILRGDYARHVEAYTRQRRYDWAEQYLREWERTFPADKLDGYLTLLRVRLETARKGYARAADEAETLVRVNPASNYGAQLLLAAAQAYRKLEKNERAAEKLKQIIRDYPESPLVAEAKKILGG